MAYLTRVNQNTDTRIEVRYEKERKADQPVVDGETFKQLPLADLFRNSKTGLSFVIDIYTNEQDQRLLRMRITHVGG